MEMAGAGEGGGFALEKVNEQNRCEPSPLRRRLGFQGSEEVERRFQRMLRK